VPELNKDIEKKEIDFDESNFVLYELPSEIYEIHVVANQSANYYFIVHALSENELAHYRKHGKVSLMRLANRVRRNKC
jgi:hypothetical protein